MSDVKNAPTTGWTSSECSLIVASILGTVYGAVPEKYAPAVLALAGVYASLRTLLKVIHALGYGKEIPDLPELPALPAVGGQNSEQQAGKES